MEDLAFLFRKLCMTYEYIFYKLSSWSEWLNCGRDPFPYQTGWFLLALLFWQNFLVFLMVTQLLFGYGFNNIVSLSKIETLALGSVFLVMNYFFFVRNKKYKKIFKKFENENKKDKLKGTLFVWAYIIVSIGAGFFFAGFLRGH